KTQAQTRQRAAEKQQTHTKPSVYTHRSKRNLTSYRAWSRARARVASSRSKIEVITQMKQMSRLSRRSGKCSKCHIYALDQCLKMTRVAAKRGACEKAFINSYVQSLIYYRENNGPIKCKCEQSQHQNDAGQQRVAATP